MAARQQLRAHAPDLELQRQLVADQRIDAAAVDAGRVDLGKVDQFQRVVAVADDLQVMRRHRRVGQNDIVVERAPDTGHLGVQGLETMQAAGEDFEDQLCHSLCSRKRWISGSVDS